MRTPALLLSLSLAFTPLLSHAASPFEIREGDRVLLIGDTLLEREAAFGALETRIDEQFADRKFTVRNLAFSADTPAGWSRASFDPAAKGFDRVKEELDLVKPTVAILGYGMAASLQEITDRSGDISLNRDPVRYGAEPMNAARFKKELGQLMDAIEASSGGSDKVRFILLSPIRHEDLRATRPGLPDPAAHNALLSEYSKAIEELAAERGARFVNQSAQRATPLTENGIHPDAPGMEAVAAGIAAELGWQAQGRTPEASAALRKAIIRKNELFFYRWRPANSTYLFGFRKHEQGRNAAEIPLFDPLVAQAEVEIEKLKAAKEALPAAPAPEPQPTPPVVVPTRPNFKIADGYQIELWAENPLLEKPTQMNWDAKGRLWVCSSSLYPMIAPGEPANDKILVLEDSDRDGKADKSAVFTGGLLLPTGVEPDLVNSGKSKDQEYGCYVGQSTELLHFGAKGEKRIVFSGFGTEDTHHIIHTLHWGGDGRLYFNQSVYIHSHIETPWGVVRLNSGGVFAYDPRNERLEVFDKGHWNSWGHQMDKWGQSFQTDGAGSTGISWAIPGAVFPAYEGSRRLEPAISPGSYPKFAGLELIASPHFPADWQGNAITCDFRAHRIVRFAFEDLARGDKPQSGYVAKEQADFIRTDDVSFRPIDVKMGPDGALYIADWSNPVINHGEVDFRDPRRDKHMGRIWRVTKKEAAIVKWEALDNKSNAELLEKLPSENLWEKEQAGNLLISRGETLQKETGEKASNDDARVRAMAMRELGRQPDLKGSELLAKGTLDPNPRVRVEAVRALAKIPTARSAELVLDAAVGVQSAGAADPYLDYAAWLSINDLARPWTNAIVDGSWKVDGHEKQLAYGLASIDPALAGEVVTAVFKDRQIPQNGSGPWIEIIGRSGGPAELQRIYDALLGSYTGDCCEDDETRAIDSSLRWEAAGAERAIAALLDAARLRNVRPPARQHLVTNLLHAPGPIGIGAIRLAGMWKDAKLPAALDELLSDKETKTPVILAAVDGLRSFGGEAALKRLDLLSRGPRLIEIRRAALLAITQLNLQEGVTRAADVLPDILSETEALETWRALLQVKDAADLFAAKLPHALPKQVAAAGVRAAREIGKRGDGLIKVLGPIGGVSSVPNAGPEVAQLIASGRAGDPARGELVYRRAGNGCVTCHAIGGAGGHVGPELTSLGASAPIDYIIESVINPNAKVKEGFNGITVTLKDGSMLSGIKARETPQELFLRDVSGAEQAVVKTNITATQNVGSIMPPGLIDQLPEQDRWDLYSFLAQLGKPGPFDASKGSVARLWTLYPGAEADHIAQGDLKSANSANAFTLVDGRLSKEKLIETLQLVTKPGESVLAVAHFQSSGKTVIKVEGAQQIFLDGKAMTAGNSGVDLSSGIHTLAVKLDLKALPEILRAESPEARFLGN
ncbi:MAG: rane-bound dehydrogenase domain protein [Chthoniobacteraceae bacterium]|nr:rane-bound dehydrogenase domain protein [Chthoniobacteraceae bacterium]